VYAYVSRADADGPDIGPDGIGRLCEDIDVSPEHVLVLVLAWKLNAATMGRFTLPEWLAGMQVLNCDNPAKLKVLFGVIFFISKKRGKKKKEKVKKRKEREKKANPHSC
jgi:hypothetical protein